MKKGSPKYESINANKVKNEIKLNVDEHQDVVKYLKEYCGLDDIEPPWKDKAVCKTCTQPIHLHEKKPGWKNIFRKSTLSCCEIIVAKCLNKEKKFSVIWIKHLIKPLIDSSSRQQE